MALNVTDLQRIMREHAEETGHDINHPKMMSSIHDWVIPTTARSFEIFQSGNDATTDAYSRHPLENKMGIDLLSGKNRLSSRKPEIIVHPNFPILYDDNSVFSTSDHPDIHLDDEGGHSEEYWNLTHPQNEKDVKNVIQHFSNFPNPILVSHPTKGVAKATQADVERFHKNVSTANLFKSHVAFWRLDPKYYVGADPSKLSQHELISVSHWFGNNSNNMYLYHPATEQLFSHKENKD